MAIVIIPGVGKVDNVTGKVVEPATQAVKKVVNAQPVKPTVTVPGVGQVGPNGQVGVVSNVSAQKQLPPANQQTPKSNTATGVTVSANPTVVGPPKMATSYANNAYGYIDKIYDAKAQNTYNTLKNAYDNSMSTINREAAKINPAYQVEKQKATSQSELQKLNFAQYLQSRGVGSGGQMQSELSRQSALGNTLGALQTNRLKAIENVNTQKSDAATKFNQKWSEYLGESNLSKTKAIQTQKQSDAKAAARAKAKAASSSSSSGGKTNTPKPLTPSQSLERPGKVNSAIKNLFGKGSVTSSKEVTNTNDPNYGKVFTTTSYSPAEQRKIWTFIMKPENQLTPDQQWNMMTQYGMGKTTDKNTGLLLGPKNLYYFINSLWSYGDAATAQNYLKKLGFKDERIANKSYSPTGKNYTVLTVDQQIQNILNGKDKYGNNY